MSNSITKYVITKNRKINIDLKLAFQINNFNPSNQINELKLSTGFISKNLTPISF